MAQKLVQYYEEASKLGGIKARMRLAMITKIPSNKAEELPDSEENIKIFEEALKEIKKEF